MAAGTPSITFIAGSAGGPVPHQVCAYATVSTGDGSREEQGFWEWRAKVNSATPTTRTEVADPINGDTRYLDINQYGANCNYLSWDEGSVTLECRYTNSSGQRSAWVTSSAVTVTAASGRTAVYMNPAMANDTGDGLTAGTAKKTWNAAVGVANALGGNVVIYVKNFTLPSNGSDITVPKVWVTKTPGDSSCTVTISGNYSMCTCVDGVDGIVVSDLAFTGTNGRVLNCEDGTTTYNICIYNCSYGGIQDVTSGAGQATIRGLSHIKLTETASLTNGQTHFSADCKGFLSWGVYSPLGSTGEHTYRFTSGGIVGRDNNYHSFMYYTGGCATTKGCLRWYGSSHLFVHGCDMRRAVYLGSHSPGDNSVGGDTISFERCIFQRYSGQTTDFAINIKSGWQKVSFRACYFNRITCFFQPRNEEDSGDRQDYFQWINCDFLNLGGQSINWQHATTINNPDYQMVKNCRFRGNTGANAYLWFKDTAQMTGYVLTGNFFERTNGDAIARNLNNGGTASNLAFAAYTALTGVTGETQESATVVDSTTMEPDDGLTTGVVSAPLPFRTYYHNRKYNPAASNFPTGSWLSAAAALADTRFFVPVAGGALVLTTS